MNKFFSILIFGLISFGIFNILFLIQTSSDNLKVKELHRMVDKEMKEYKNLKKHIDNH